MPNVLVLDAWALIGWLMAEEPSRSVVRGVLRAAEAGRVALWMSWVNAGEVYCTVAKRYGTPRAEEFLDALQALPLRLDAPDRSGIIAAARLKGRFAIAYADAFAGELAMRLKARLLTGDPEFLALEKAGLIPLEWLVRRE